jgi:Phage integrase family
VHILRHTFCSHLVMRGAPARPIQELAGHQDLATTQRYMHLSPAAIEGAIALLETSVKPSVASHDLCEREASTITRLDTDDLELVSAWTNRPGEGESGETGHSIARGLRSRNIAELTWGSTGSACA